MIKYFNILLEICVPNLEMMEKILAFLIPFVGLKGGLHHFEFNINNEFFEIYNFFDFKKSDVKVHLAFEKKVNMLKLDFNASGKVTVPCDVTNEYFDLSVKSDFNLIVKFGEIENYNDDELLILPHGSYQIDVAPYIYEMTVLSIPAKKVHPGIENGTLKSEILEKLKNLEPRENPLSGQTDPRWDKLKDLL